LNNDILSLVNHDPIVNEKNNHTTSTDTIIIYIYNNRMNDGDIYNSVIRTLNESFTPLNTVFFSKQNVSLLQQQMKVNVYKKTGHIIGEQNVGDLLTIMGNIYTENGFSTNDVSYDVQRLNSLVVREASPQIENGLIAYIKYLEAINSKLNPLPYGVDSSGYGEDDQESFPIGV